MGIMEKVKHEFQTDNTINTIRRKVSTAWPRLPSATAQYLIEKVPIVQWLPRYSPKWLLSDAMAGLTIGVMMIPQALAYAKIATIPGEYGLYSSWLPAAFYVLMGTSKDLSTGPTSIMGLLTAEVVLDLSKEGYQSQDIASALALMVGFYSLALGLLKLGFLLDYISVPVLSGFLSAAALTILLGQVGSLVGLTDVPTGTANIIRDILSRLPQWEPRTVAIGFTGIIMLYLLEWIGKKWGKQHAWIKFVSCSRAVILLIIYTSISYGVNKGLKTPLWEISKVTAKGIIPPKAPNSALISKVATRAVAPLVASALEHLAIGKAFGRKNDYAIDESQELCYLGVTNAVNSLFGAMTVGGAMSRTAVNSECGVKSPLSGVMTAGFIVLTIYKLSGALYWIPKATLSAIIIMAVVHVIGPASLFYRYWRISFLDFVASMLSFWITLFVSTEIGIAVAVGFSIIYTMLRAVFPKVQISPATNGALPESAIQAADSGDDLFVPSDAMLIRFSDAIFFPNALRIKKSVLESVQVMYDQHYTLDQPPRESSERSWSVASQKRIEVLRKRKRITTAETPMAVMVWDFTHVPFVDVTGVMLLWELKEEIQKHLGKKLKLRCVGMSGNVRRRFQRANWKFVAEEDEAEAETLGADVVYSSLEAALRRRAREQSFDSSADFEKSYYKHGELSSPGPPSPV